MWGGGEERGRGGRGGGEGGGKGGGMGDWLAPRDGRQPHPHQQG